RRYTPRHNGKIERYQRLMTDECLYARAYDSENERRDAIGVWNHHYNYHRPHTACGDQPPASRLHAGVDNVMTNYSYCAMQNAGMWGVSALAAGSPDLEYGVFRLPVPDDGEYVTATGGWAFAANARGRDPEAAARFCVWALGSM